MSDRVCDNDALAEALPIKKRRFSKSFPAVAASLMAPYDARLSQAALLNLKTSVG
jgi:hypothetical protein